MYSFLCRHTGILKQNIFRKINLEECCLPYKLIWCILHESYFWWILSEGVKETSMSEIFCLLFHSSLWQIHIYSTFPDQWNTLWLDRHFLAFCYSFSLLISLFFAPLHDFENVGMHRSMQNISNYVGFMRQVWINRSLLEKRRICFPTSSFFQAICLRKDFFNMFKLSVKPLEKCKNLSALVKHFCKKYM